MPLYVLAVLLILATFLPCKSEKYKSVAFFIISGLQLESVNSSNSRVRDNLKSLYGEEKKRKNKPKKFSPKLYY